MDALKNALIVPLVQSDDPRIAVKTAKALLAGGLSTLEVVWRTDAAMDCLEAIKADVPGARVGAGTVLTPAQVSEAAERGAQFIVSPGVYPGVIEASDECGLEVFPGIATSTELQLAWNFGLRTVKFFPAALVGGTAMVKALASVFRGVRFMPTGGVSESNLGAYLEIPEVIACGGSWLTPKDEIAAGNFHAVTRLAKEALAIARETRPNT